MALTTRSETLLDRRAAIIPDGKAVNELHASVSKYSL